MNMINIHENENEIKLGDNIIYETPNTNNKHKGYTSKHSNFTNVSTVDTTLNLSKDALTPYGTKSDLSNTLINSDLKNS